jgi:NarL family two-component system sensor histidine kinase LiaS
LFKKIKKDNIMNLIELYRFISILLTVFIYMIRGFFERYSILIMLFLVACVIVSAFLLHYLYRRSCGTRVRLHLLLLIEILGISFLMAVTGGLKSPFIWCFLNPLLIISYYMHPRQKTFYLVSNFILLCGIGYYVERSLGIREYLLLNSNIILSFTLLIILVNILFYYNRQIINNQKKLTEAYKDLENYNARIKGMTNDILYMYEAVQSVSSHRDKIEIINIILDFAARVVPGCNAFFVPEDCREDHCMISSKMLDDDIKSIIVNKIKDETLDVSHKYVAVYTVKEGLTAAFIRVSNIKGYGIIGLLTPQEEFQRNKSEYESNLLLISQLGATFFEKIEAELISNELAVADEQNRIADDIHDSVIQRLFASSCFAYDTINRWDAIPDDSKKEQMMLIRETIQSSLKDLRSTIYNLSSKNRQIELFRDSVQNYLYDMERLSGMNISLDIKGEPDRLTLSGRKALYRIITECTGNAIKHSKGRNIWVSMAISDTRTSLSIRDDGIGLDLEKAERKKNGLGLYNIKSLVRIFNGTINIDTKKGLGTTFDIVFNNSDILRV